MSAEIKKFLSRDQLLDLPDLKTEEVYVEEWASHVRIRSLTGTERDQFESDSVERKGKNYEANLKNLRARLVVLTVVDEAGKRVFADKDVAAVGRKNAAALNTIFEAARKLSGMTKEDVEELEKNLEPDPSEEPTSA